MPDIETTVARLQDEAAIRDATARFAESIMRRDLTAFRALWTRDGEWTIGGTDTQPFERRAAGADDVVALLDGLWQGNDHFVHFAVQGSIEIDGDEARTSCVCHESASGPGRYYRTHGVWSDRLRREGGTWLFTSRSYRYLWLDMSPFTGDTFPLRAESSR